MTGLHRTSLTTSQKVECAALAMAGQGCHGTVSAVRVFVEGGWPLVMRLRCSIDRAASSDAARRFRHQDVEVGERTPHGVG